MGDGEAFQLADQIKEFLKESGYKSVEGIARVVMSKPHQGIVVFTDPDDADYRIHVGSK